jgi:serine protease Do
MREVTGMYNDFDYNSYYYRQNRPPRNKGGIAKYIAIVLITSLISSTTVGVLLYNKFSAELKHASSYALNEAAENGADIAEPVRYAQQIQDGIYSLGDGAEDLTQARQDTGAADELKGGGTGSVSAKSTALPKGSDVTAIAKLAGPSIVGIRMTISGTRYNYYGISNSQVAEGSGIIIRKDGYIMTNYHVVSGADPKSSTSSRTILEVFLPDGREAKAKFIGGDEKTDLAVIKVDLTGLPVAELGDSSKLEVGELAVAIGNPLGMEFAGSVTVGVISALNRSLEIENRTLNLIQTDAAINEGNSGGALLNSQGQVIGINSAKIAASGVEGLGFAIPINDAWPIVDQLIKYGYVKGRPFIGISGTPITSVYARSYGLAVGIYVTDVTAGSGAEKAGIKAGDIIVSMAGKTIETIKDLDTVKESYKPGDTVTVTVVRDGKKLNLKLTFGEEK